MIKFWNWKFYKNTTISFNCIIMKTMVKCLETFRAPNSYLEMDKLFKLQIKSMNLEKKSRVGNCGTNNLLLVNVGC